MIRKIGSLGWRRGPGNTSRKTQIPLICDVTHRESQIQNWKNFFGIEGRRLAESVDGLNTSLAQSPRELWLKWSLTIYRLLRSLKGGNAVLHDVSCLLGCLPGSYQMIRINQAQHVMRGHVMIVFTYWPILTFLYSFRHERMLVFRTLGLV